MSTRNPRHPLAVRFGRLSGLWQHRALIWQMTRRDVTGRYRGSFAGLLWSLLHPVLMLVVYTLVFGGVFHARWGEGAHESRAEFALILFAGMIVHSLCAETLNRSASLILHHANYVKKVVFPLEILPCVTLGTALFHAGVSLGVLLAGLLLVNHFIHWTVFFLPLIWFPLMLLVLGGAWFLAATGVYVRDMGQITGIAMTVLLFLSPVFYSVEVLPATAARLMHLNPLTFIIEQTRAVLIRGEMPDWGGLGIYLLIAMVVARLGYVLFDKMRPGFADVL
jgi:lipopolysaccharide transport system permease protein